MTTVTPIQHVYNDGGRAAAGYKGHTTDCSCRAIAIATGQPYQTVYDALNAYGARERTRKRRPNGARTGITMRSLRKYMAALGWRWVPTMHIGQGCRVHLRANELPMGRLVVLVSRHLCAVLDGVIHDTHDPSRDGMRCVYWYWVAA